MKKLIVTGIITLLSMMTFAALTYGQSGGPGPGHAMPGAHDKDGPGMGHGKMEGCCMGGHGMMGDHGMMGGRMMEAEHHLARLLEGLALDDQQKKVIGEIKSSMKKDTIRKMADISIARIELRELILQDPLEMKAVEAKVRQLESLRAEMHLAHIKAMENIKTKLTPDQRKKLMNMIKTGPMMMHD
jgi:Spy/CpxP family protein refolding chaperone